MRSYHIADKNDSINKLGFATIKIYFTDPEFDPTTGESSYKNIANQEYTSDGGAGGVEIFRLV